MKSINDFNLNTKEKQNQQQNQEYSLSTPGVIISTVAVSGLISDLTHGDTNTAPGATTGTERCSNYTM